MISTAFIDSFLTSFSRIESDTTECPSDSSSKIRSIISSNDFSNFTIKDVFLLRVVI